MKALLREIRNNAQTRSGYVTGVSFESITNRDTVMISSDWDSTEDWRGWQFSPERKAFIERLEQLLEAPVTIEIWEESKLVF